MLTRPKPVIVWTYNIANKLDDTPFPSNATLELTTQGLLFTTTHDHQQKIKDSPIILLPADHEDADITSAALFDSGNFLLFGNNSVVIWDSFDYPTDTILGGQNLTREEGRELVSTGLGYRLSWRRDDTLVLYAPNSFSRPENAYWEAPYNNSGDLCLSNTGLLYFSTSNSTILANGTTGYNQTKSRDTTTVIYRATLDADGIFRLYAHQLFSNKSSIVSTRWSNLKNQCDVKGFCGLNSYCVGEGKRADCCCYPGFVVNNGSAKGLGCYHNFSEDSCRSKEQPRLRYDISTLKNMTWEDHPYSVTPMPKKEMCSQFCLKDCNCWAALYLSPNCRKYRLPLRYGKMNPNLLAAAFFKVVSGKFNDAKHDDESPPENQSENGTVLVLGLSFGSFTLMCLVFAATSFFIYRHRVYRYKRLFENANVGLTEDFSLQSFSYDELERATDGFKEELGRGPFGAVYKGTTLSSSNKTIAVKRLERGAEEGIREFRAEMATIGRTHHRNLVQLLGFCIEGSKRLLVYEFMSNGSLADFLFKASVRHPALRERVRLVLDVARGLFYLHEECGVHIIHCNLKPQNILLDDTLTAKISDFGFARLLMPKQGKESVGVEESTRSYFAPEWKKNALISVKSDIYSFGIVLLEIICCRRSIDVKASSPDQVDLCDWVCDCFVGGQLSKLVELDEDDVNMRTIERTVKVGIWCIQDDPDLRPSMNNVILMLEGTMDIPLPPTPTFS